MKSRRFSWRNFDRDWTSDQKDLISLRLFKSNWWMMTSPCQRPLSRQKINQSTFPSNPLISVILASFIRIEETFSTLFSFLSLLLADYIICFDFDFRIIIISLVWKVIIIQLIKTDYRPKYPIEPIETFTDISYVFLGKFTLARINPGLKNRSTASHYRLNVK